MSFLVTIFASLKYNSMTSLAIFLGELVSPGHVIIILAVVLLLFGGKKIPELMKGLGSGVKEFKNAAKEDEKPAEKKEE
jgi:sec-independent protein translocase protein TatA